MECSGSFKGATALGPVLNVARKGPADVHLRKNKKF